MTSEEFRVIALSFPGTIEAGHMGHPDFRMRGKIFATLGYPNEEWAMVKLDPEVQAALVAAKPEVFKPAAGAWGRSGCTLVHLRSARKSFVRDALATASHTVAEKTTLRTTKSAASDARRELESFIDQFSPEIASLARTSLATLREMLPGAYELVYDNAYALVIGFGPSERPSEAIFSIAIYPRKVGLCFLYGAGLHDPNGLLQGEGHRVRHIRLETPRTLKTRAVRALMKAAIGDRGIHFDQRRRGRIVIRAVSNRRRPRRRGMG
jgi:hypothetical protein